MSNLLHRIVGDKKEWRGIEARADALPRDYRVVYREIKKYVFRFTAGDATDIVELLTEVLVLFEAGAADGRAVLDVTGEDVAAFCDERLRGARPEDRYLAKWRTSLNEDVTKQLWADRSR